MKKERETRTPGTNRGLGWGAGRVAFLARANEIQGLLDAGHPMTTVYAQLREKLAGLSYEGFRYHVNRQRVDSARAKAKAAPPTRPSNMPAAPPAAPSLTPTHPPAPASPAQQKSTDSSQAGQVGKTFKYNSQPREFS